MGPIWSQSGSILYQTLYQEIHQPSIGALGFKALSFPVQSKTEAGRDTMKLRTRITLACLLVGVTTLAGDRRGDEGATSPRAWFKPKRRNVFQVFGIVAGMARGSLGYR